MIRAWGIALTLLVVVGCSSAPPTPPPTPRGSSVILGANVVCGAFEDRADLCHDMAATAIDAVSVHSIEVRDVWLKPQPLCYASIVCLFDPTAPAPGATPPLGGVWVGSAEVSFDDVTEHAGVNLARLNDKLVVKQIGYGVPPPTWCSGGCPSSGPGGPTSASPFVSTLAAPSSDVPLGWRLIGTERLAGKSAYQVHVATSNTEWQQIWSSMDQTSDPPPADFSKEIVAVFVDGVGSSCPDLVLDDVVIDQARRRVYSLNSNPLGDIACTADLAGAVAFFVAMDRGALPASPFAVSLNPPDRCAGLTCVGVEVNLNASAPTSPSYTAQMPTPIPTLNSDYDVKIAAALAPHWSAAEAAAAAFEQLLIAQRMAGSLEGPFDPRIISVLAVAGSDVPRQFSGPDPEYPIVWIVRAHGAFNSLRGYSGPLSAVTDGYFTYADDGSSIGFGF